MIETWIGKPTEVMNTRLKVRKQSIAKWMTRVAFVTLFLETLLLLVLITEFRLIKKAERYFRNNSISTLFKDYHNNPVYHAQRKLSLSYSVSEKSTFLIGDSLVSEVQWHEFMPEIGPVVNRGIRGDTLEGVRDRIAAIAQYKLSRVIVWVGINNLLRKQKYTAVLRDLDRLISDLKKLDCPVYFCTLAPVSKSWVKSERLNHMIESFNFGLKQRVSDSGIELVDLHAVLVGPDMHLGNNLAYDGLHLNENGYARVKEALLRHVGGPKS
jgi:lysophospholipase L1-like esterase